MDRRRFVVNASPLIFLSHLEKVELLEQLGHGVIVPRQVVSEVLAGKEAGPKLEQLFSVPWIRIADDSPLPEEIAGWDLGAGESQVLAVALASPGSEAVLDDRQARHCAIGLGIDVTGTLGLLLRAKKAGLIPAARPLVAELVRRKLYLSRDLVETFLADIGE